MAGCKHDHDRSPEALAVVGGAAPLSTRRLGAQNAVYAGTAGISANNRHAGFVPGYRNTATGEICASCFADGTPAAVHVLDGLPGNWVSRRDDRGRVTRTIDGIVAGFIRGGCFYSRAEALIEAAQPPPSAG